MKEFRKLRADEIECRVGTNKDNGCSILLYKDARCDMRLLDEVVGPMNWRRSHKMIGDRLYCEVSIWDAEKGEWVSKEDVGVESRTEQEKGQASDSFKRACFNWGIGRELYTAPFIWINGKIPHGLHCTEISYDDNGNINKLVLCDGKGEQIYSYGVTTRKAANPIREKIIKEAMEVQTRKELVGVFNKYISVTDCKEWRDWFNKRREALNAG